MRPAGEAARDELVCQLTPRPDGTKVVRPLPMQTPWRVVLIGDRPGALLESETIYCLNEPSVIKDTSWIKPGKITFPWWNGDVYDGQPGAAHPLVRDGQEIHRLLRAQRNPHPLADLDRKHASRHGITSRSRASSRDRTPTSPGRAPDSTWPPSGATRNPSRCGCGPGCTRAPCAAGWKRRSPRSRNSAGAA